MECLSNTIQLIYFFFGISWALLRNEFAFSVKELDVVLLVRNKQASII